MKSSKEGGKESTKKNTTLVLLAGAEQSPYLNYGVPEVKRNSNAHKSKGVAKRADKGGKESMTGLNGATKSGYHQIQI